MEQHNSLVLVWDMQMLAQHIVFIWKHMSVVDRMEWKPQPCWFFKGWLNKITIAYANLLKLHYFVASFGRGKILIHLFIRRFMLKFDQSLLSLLLLLLLLLPLMVGWKTLCTAYEHIFRTRIAFLRVCLFNINDLTSWIFAMTKIHQPNHKILINTLKRKGPCLIFG